MRGKPSHSSSIVNTQLYYDEFPLGVLLPWHKSFYARTQNPLAEGTADADSTNYLVDSGKNFIDAGVSVGDIAYNETDGTYSSVVSVSTTALELSNDAFDNGNEDYQIFREPVPPVGWMEYSSNKITDKESPFYGMTPEDIIGEERFLRFCEVSGINQDHQFEDHTHSFSGTTNVLRWVGSGGTLSPSAGSTVTGEVLSIGNSSSGNSGDETRPTNISMVAIFKYKKAPAQTATFQADKVITDELNISSFVSMVDDFAVELPSDSWELFELNTPDCVSSKGRVPVKQNINYQPARATMNGLDTVTNQFIKWTDRGTVGIFAPQTPQIVQPEDLSNTGGWTATNVTATLSDHWVQGHRLTELEVTSAGGDVVDNLPNIANSGSGYMILKNKNATSTRINMNGYASNDITITWATQSILDDTYTTTLANWLDDDTVEIYWIFGGAVDTVTDLKIFPADTGTGTIYVGAVNIQGNNAYSPYTRLGREEGFLEYPFDWTTGKFSFGGWFNPCFPYDASTNKRVVSIREDAFTEYIEVIYNTTVDQFQVSAYQGTNIRYLYSEQFDDGTSYSNVNQWLYIAGALDLTTASTSGSWFKVYGDNGTSSTKDTVWDGALDTFTTLPPKLRFGNLWGGNFSADGWFSDFIFRGNYLWTEEEADAHYTENKPYYSSTRLLGDRGNFKLDKFGNAYFKNMVVG